MLNITKKRLKNIKKIKKQSKKRLPKRRKNKKRRKKSFRRRRKSFNLKNKTLKYLKGGATRDVPYLGYNKNTKSWLILTFKEDENGNISGIIKPEYLLDHESNKPLTLDILSKLKSFEINEYYREGAPVMKQFKNIFISDDDGSSVSKRLQFAFNKKKVKFIPYKKLWEENKQDLNKFQDEVIKAIIESHKKLLPIIHEDNIKKVEYKADNSTLESKTFKSQDELELEELLEAELAMKLVGDLIQKSKDGDDPELTELENKAAALNIKMKEFPTTNIDFITILNESNSKLVTNKNAKTDFINKKPEDAPWIINMISKVDATKFGKILKRKKEFINTLKKEKHGPSGNMPWVHARANKKFLKEKFQITDTFADLLAKKIRHRIATLNEKSNSKKQKGGADDDEQKTDITQKIEAKNLGKVNQMVNNMEENNDIVNDELATILAFAEYIDIQSEKENVDLLWKKLKLAGPYDKDNKSGISSSTVLSIYGIGTKHEKIQEELSKCMVDLQSPNADDFFKKAAKIIQKHLGIETKDKGKDDKKDDKKDKLTKMTGKVINAENEQKLDDDKPLIGKVVGVEDPKISKLIKKNTSGYTRPHIYMEAKLKLDKDGEPSDYQPYFTLEKSGFHKDAREWLKHVNVNIE